MSMTRRQQWSAMFHFPGKRHRQFYTHLARCLVHMLGALEPIPSLDLDPIATPDEESPIPESRPLTQTRISFPPVDDVPEIVDLMDEDEEEKPDGELEEDPRARYAWAFLDDEPDSGSDMEEDELTPQHNC